MNNSISVTLEKFYTETKVTFNDQLTQDQFWLNGEKVSGKELEKISKYMDIVRNRAGIDWYAEIESDNFVPTAAGLASSASAYAALAAACNQALNMQLSIRIYRDWRELVRVLRRVVFMVDLQNGKKGIVMRRHMPFHLNRIILKMTLP